MFLRTPKIMSFYKGNEENTHSFPRYENYNYYDSSQNTISFEIYCLFS